MAMWMRKQSPACVFSASSYFCAVAVCPVTRITLRAPRICHAPMCSPLGAPLRAPNRDRLQPTVFAIRSARVITEPGKVLNDATVVIRDGLIEAAGKDVKAPTDALVIDGKGLTVYPGFIDALNTWG